MTKKKASLNWKGFILLKQVKMVLLWGGCGTHADYLDIPLLYNVFNKLRVITSKISWDYLNIKNYNQFPENTVTFSWFEFAFWPKTSKAKLCVSIVIYILLQFFIYDS